MQRVSGRAWCAGLARLLMGWIARRRQAQEEAEKERQAVAADAEAAAAAAADAGRDGQAAGEAEEAEGKDSSRRGSSLDVQARDTPHWGYLQQAGCGGRVRVFLCADARGQNVSSCRLMDCGGRRYGMHGRSAAPK